MNNIIENYYYIIIFVGLFIIFTLVGYLVELIKKNRKKLNEMKEETMHNSYEDIVQDEDKEIIKKEVITVSNDDELLNDYNSFEK